MSCLWENWVAFIWPALCSEKGKRYVSNKNTTIKLSVSLKVCQWYTYPPTKLSWEMKWNPMYVAWYMYYVGMSTHTTNSVLYYFFRQFHHLRWMNSFVSLLPCLPKCQKWLTTSATNWNATLTLVSIAPFLWCLPKRIIWHGVVIKGLKICIFKKNTEVLFLEWPQLSKWNEIYPSIYLSESTLLKWFDAIAATIYTKVHT